MKDPAPDLSIVIVSWNVEQLLRPCLSSVLYALSKGQLSAETFVIDNSSSDQTVPMVRSEFPQVHLIANDVNLGFTKGNNLALTRCRGRQVLLLNPDTQVAPRSLRTMFDYLECHPEAGAVGPQLVFPDGCVQPSRRRFPTLSTALLESTVFQRFVPNHRALRHYFVADLPPDREQMVDWLVGACLMLRRTALDRIGLLDEGFFMYSEELDWCRRIKAAGWSIVYLPSAEVMHFEAKSSEQNVLARHKHFHDSKVRYFRKYHGQPAAFLVRLAIVLSFALMLAEETLKYVVVPRKRVWRRPRLGTLAAALAHHARRLICS